MSKQTILILVGRLTSVSMGDDVKTVSGKEYKKVTVTRQEAHGTFATARCRRAALGKR